jgi:hypothetical protein
VNRAEERDTQDRKRAKDAYDRISALQHLDKVCARAQSLPIEVRSQGLTVAVATLIKEDRAESRTLADWLAGWLFNKNAGIVDDESNPTARRLLERATRCERGEYLAFQAEALAYLEHVKRLLSAFEKGGRP